ncbi:DUF488 domain-containing protein [Pelomicrobium sp. G1]|uniref:DUF488 domain-containing protein n=1 Tax=unclassified Pelomicrobium TaxID=2815318 RepID=UPI003F757B94
MALVYTVGHGARPGAALIDLLAAQGVAWLVDVRAYPVSRRHPQFERARLEASLREAGIRYQWQGKALGGFRAPGTGSPHGALEEPAFRGFADHMQTEAFRAAVAEILSLAQQTPLALMCAEQAPQRCHRSLIADYLCACGNPVVHLLQPGMSVRHRLHPAARWTPEGLVYDGGRVQARLDFTGSGSPGSR